MEVSRLLWVAALFGCQEFRLDPIDPDGPPPVSVATEDRFVQAPNPAVDLLFVVDASASMDQEIAALGGDVATLLDTLDGFELDWQIGVVDADVEALYGGWLRGSPYVLTAGAVDPVARFAERLPVAGAGGEAGLAAAVRALELAAPDGPNAGFRRPGAVLQVVFVSDDDDGSGAVLPDPADAFLHALEAESDAGQPVRAVALVGDVPDGCVSALGAAQPGFAYAGVAQASGGRTASICAPDFVELFADLGADSVSLPGRFELSQRPVAGTVAIEIDGEPTDAFALQGRTVVFDEPPPAGAVIRVRYVVREPAP